MKKIYLAALTLAMTACVSNDDLNPVDNYGYIDVNVSNDPIMVTRADDNVMTVSDLTNWKVKITDSKNTVLTYNAIELQNNTFVAGAYKVTAYNYADDAAAHANNINDGWGDARYEGKDEEVTVSAGLSTQADIACGKAKNARIKATFNLPTDFTSVSLVFDPTDDAVDGTERNLVTETTENSEKYAYFTAETPIKYVLKYKYKNNEPKEIKKEITLGAGGTEKVIAVSANSNGKITLNITTADFTTEDGHKFIIDAASGEVESQPADANS